MATKRTQTKEVEAAPAPKKEAPKAKTSKLTPDQAMVVAALGLNNNA
jgi:hypothetical protein